MLNLPASTELKKALPKVLIFRKFGLSSAKQDIFDTDISRITIIHEISPRSLSIPPGKEVDGFFVLHVQLKRKDYREENLRLLTRLIPQHMIFLLTYEEQAQLAMVHTRVIHTEWQRPESLTLPLEGLTLDTVWQNCIATIGRIEVKEGQTLDEAQAKAEGIQQLEKKIDQLKKRLAREKQSKKKFEIFQSIQKLSKELEELNHG